MINGIGPARAFPPLTEYNVNALFAHVYEVLLPDHPSSEERPDEAVADFLPLALAYARFVLDTRRSELVETYHSIAHQLGRIETNSEGADCWLALIIAIVELYQLSLQDIAELLSLIHTDG